MYNSLTDGTQLQSSNRHIFVPTIITWLQQTCWPSQADKTRWYEPPSYRAREKNMHARYDDEMHEDDNIEKKKKLYVTDGFTLRKYIKIYSYPSRHARRHTVSRERSFMRSYSISHSYNHHQVKMLLSESGAIQMLALANIYKATQMLVWLFNLCLSDRSKQINISQTFGSLNHTEKGWHSSKDTVLGRKRERMYIWMDGWM